MIPTDLLVTGFLAMILVPYWLALAIMNSLLAKRKVDQNPTVSFALSILFGPLVYLYLLALPNKP